MAYEFDALQFTIHLVVGAGLAFVAYGVRVLDVGGSLLAFGLAILILETTGWETLILLITFVALGFAVTKLYFKRKQALGVAEGKTGTRGWRNVAANGGVPGIISMMALLGLPREDVALGFIASIATAAADTFASELGVMSGRVYLITKPWMRVERGTNGGVSEWGQLMALLGASIAGVAGVLLLDIPVRLAWIPVVAGWLGCQIDSVLGALFEEERGRAYGFLTKSDVNFLSNALASFGLLVLLTL